jgi:serine/threonine-protein kinase
MRRPGDVIGGKYELVRELGRGGMGVVFEAAHLSLQSRVAIKFLSPAFAEDRVALERFAREARAAAAVGHEAIVTIHDIGATDDGLPYTVMELLRGRSLCERLAEERRLDIPTAAYIACQVLSGLAAVHDTGIIHRDLKPGNIFLTESGSLVPGVKIFDFGIARLVGAQGITAPKGHITKTGVAIGTPEYMSPEQALGNRDIDQRSDLFSLGVIFYEAITGTIPFTGGSYVELLSKLIDEAHAPLRSLRPEVPAHLEAVIDRALAKDPAARQASAIELFNELVGYVEEAALGRLIVPSGLEVSRSSLRPSSSPEIDPHSDTVLALDAPASGRLERVTTEKYRRHDSARRRHWWVAAAFVMVAVGAGVGGLYAAAVDRARGEVPPSSGAAERRRGAPGASGSSPERRRPADAGARAPAVAAVAPASDAGATTRPEAGEADGATGVDASPIPSEIGAPHPQPRTKRPWHRTKRPATPPPTPPPPDEEGLYVPPIVGDK